MYRDQVKTAAQDIIREKKSEIRSIRHEQIVILDALADVIDAVEPDIDYLHELTSKSSLGDRLKARLKGERKAELNTEEIYTLNEEAMIETVGKVSGALCELEKQHTDETSRQRKRIEELAARLEEAEKAEKQLRESMRNMRDNTATSLQNILSIIGEHVAESENVIFSEINRMAAKLGISVVWSSENNPDAEFEVLKVENLSSHKERPCLIRDGEVLQHGIRFEAVKGDAQA